MAYAERAHYIDQMTDGCAEVVQLMLAVMRDADQDVKVRLHAAEWLSDHSSAGRAALQAEIEVAEAPSTLDLSGLSMEELLAWRALAAKAARPALIEVAPVAEIGPVSPDA